MVYKTLAEAEVLGPPVGSGPSLGADVLLAYGSEDQKREWLPRLARGEELWCQFFSEPGAEKRVAMTELAPPQWFQPADAVSFGYRVVVATDAVAGTPKACRVTLLCRRHATQ